MSSALSEHEYEPIGNPSMMATLSTLRSPMNTAPVVRINDTDVVHVADSDESIDVQERRYSPKQLVLDGDVIVPLDGEIEDSAMQARELGETGDTSEDQETAQQLQDRLEERFLNAATPCTESRTDAEINTSQVDSSALEELPLRRGARGLPQRLRSQAGKLRSRLRGIQRPSFSLPERQKTDKTKTTKTVEKPKPVKAAKTAKPEKSRFSLPDRPKFSLPDRPKFNFPDRPKFNLPERPKFNIKRPNINLPTLGRVRKPLKERQNSGESSSSTKRNIFDFSTYPRLFDKKSKSRGEYATSSPKASRAQSPESATVPRVKKKTPIGAKWVQRFSDIKYADDEPDSAAERSKPWRHPSIEEPQVAFRQETVESRERLPWEESDDRSVEGSRDRPQDEHFDERELEEVAGRVQKGCRINISKLPVHEQETVESRGRLPWEESDDRSVEGSRDRPQDEHFDERELEAVAGHVQDVGYNEEDSVEIENRRIIVELPLGRGFPPEDLEDDIPEDIPDPRLYPRGLGEDSFEDVKRAQGAKEKWLHGPIVNDVNDIVDQPDEEGEEIEHRDSYGDEEYSGEMNQEDGYGGDFLPIDPPRKLYLPREHTPDETSLRSDREQQSSGSSCDRRRRGVLEEIDSDEFFLRAKGISQDDMNMGRFLASEIRDAFRPTINALADHDLDHVPPTRPVRTRSLRKRREENPPESYGATPPARPKRDRRRSEDSLRADEYQNFMPDKTGSMSGSRHRVIYQAEGIPGAIEPLDDIVVVKPARRKSRSVARSYSECGSEVIQPPPLPPTPPVAPRRRKRGRRDAENNRPYVNGHRSTVAACNGHRQEMEWQEGIMFPSEVHNTLEMMSQEPLQTFVNRLDHEYIEPAPIAPKRRSRSRGTSVADDDRTSRGAESLPEVSYVEEDREPPQDQDSRDLPGYAVVDKREKPPRPPPPRRRRDKFATSPKIPSASSNPAVPVRPQRAYSTLGPSRKRSVSEDRSVNQMDVTPYTELDSDDPDSRDLRSVPVLEKIQGRPLPAPPRPPRARREASDQVDSVSNGVVEVAASTQTDPLPDDVVIEEEVTRATLVMAPSRSGSQILVSTERIASPTFGRNSPAVPPLPQSIDRDRFRNTPSPILTQFIEPADEIEEEKAEDQVQMGTELVVADRPLTPLTGLTSIPIQQEDRIRIASLEVADLRVERLNVNQIEAHKISASEVDAVVVSASEISSTSNTTENDIHPSLLRELIAIRNHLEQAASARQAREATPEKKNKDETSSVVNQLIESLKNSDRKEEEQETQDFMEESAEVEDETKTDAVIEQEKISEELDSLQEVYETMQEDEKTIEEIEISRETPVSVEIIQTEPKVEEIPDSSSLEKSTESDTTLQSSITENPPETAEPHVPPSVSTPAKEESQVRGRLSRGDEGRDDKRKSSRSRSSSPTKDGKRFVRQTASPVKSLPPLISVTPDIPDPVPSPVPEAHIQPQRAIMSYAQNIDEESYQPQPNSGVTQYVAFPTSQIPANFFSLASPVASRFEPEPSIANSTQQLMRALRLAGTRAMRTFVGYVVSRVNVEDRGEKTKEIELAICALLLLIAGLLILCFGSPRTVMHHHHWDYFNPPQ